MDGTLRILHGLNVIFGTAILLLGFGAFLGRGLIVPLLMALGLASVGPVEDMLKGRAGDDEYAKQVVDKSTSLVYLWLSLAAMLLSIRRSRRLAEM